MAKIVKVAPIVKRGRTTLAAGEKEPRPRFIRVAGMRMSKALLNVKLLQRCMNRAQYEYEDAEVMSMLKDLRRAVDRLEKAYQEAQVVTSNGKPKATVNKLPNYFNK